MESESIVMASAVENKKRISIIIPVCNALAYTKVCISRLRDNLRGISGEIIVVDNASEDDSLQWLQQQEDVFVIHNDEPCSVAKSFNQGLEIATGQLLLFMHNDTVLPKLALHRLIKTLEQADDVAAIGPVTHNSMYPFCDPFFKMDGYKELEELDAAAEKLYVAVSANLRPVSILEDYCLLIKREAVEELGTWDESFPLRYFEDVDYSYRMLKAGLKLAVAANIFVHHEKSRTFEALGIDNVEAVRMQVDLFKEKWGFDCIYCTCLRNGLLQFIDMNKPELAVLDIGCAAGTNLCSIKARRPDAKLCGIEIVPEVALLASLYGDIRNDDIEMCDIDEWIGSFDYIVMGDVIEHLRDPWTALKRVKKLLKPGGKVIASIPNIMNAITIYEILAGKFEYTDAGVLDRTHLRFFTKAEIAKLFSQAGFQYEFVGTSSIWTEQNENSQKVIDAMLDELSSLKLVQVDREALQVLQYYVLATSC